MKPHTQLLRAFIEPDKKLRRPPKRPKKSEFARQQDEMREAELILGPDAWPWFGPMLVFDCETTTGIGQELRFGFFQERGANYRELIENMRFSKQSPTCEYMDTMRSEGSFYNPKTCSGDEIETMRTYCDKYGVRFLTFTEFLHDVFYKTYYYKRWNMGETARSLPLLVIGHNLPFDLGAISYGASPNRGEDYYGGLTVKLFEKRPDIAIRKLGFGKHMYNVHQDRGERRNHQFIDTIHNWAALYSVPAKTACGGCSRN